MPKSKNGLTRPATDQTAGPEIEKNPPKLKPQRIDLTPPEPLNVGYVGGVRVPKKK